MLRNTVFSRLSIVMIVCFTLVGLSLIALVQQSTQNHQREVKQRLHLDLAKHVVKFNPLLSGGEIDKVALKAAFETMMVLGPGFEFYLVDVDGKILAYSAEEGKVKRETIAMAPVRKFLSQSELLPIVGDDPRSFERKKIFSVAPVYNQKDIKAYLYVIIGGEIYDDVVELFSQSHIMQLSLWAILSILVFGLLTSLLVFFWLTRPIRRLDQDMQAFRNNAFSPVGMKLHHWQKESTNEVHRLGSTFHEMAEHIAKQVAVIKDNEKQRTQMLSHISHDLRTPLASLKGYLETWTIKEGDKATEEGKKYIETARKNAKQLSSLVEQIFELIHLESNTVRLNCEPVAIAELVQDLLQKFTLDIEGKSLKVHVTPMDSSLFVSADIEKLERVLTNLIENAINICDQGDSITVRFKDSDEKIEVSIADSGGGIHEDELEKIFQPHYRGKNSKKSAKGNSGLGLAITKRLLELHETDINVTSQLNQGSTFWFDLPRVELVVS